MMREQKIPPQPGIPFKLNHNFPRLDTLHVQIAGLSGKNMTLKPSLAASDGKIKCIVNSFDASGGNTSLVVEEAPEPLSKEENPLPCHVVCISAKTSASLKANRRRLLDYLMKNPNTKIADLAYTTTARRMHEVLRASYNVKSTKEITNLLREDVSKETSNDPKTKPLAMNVVFAFTGQGSQYAGMGRQLYEHSLAFRDFLHTYQQIARHQSLPDFVHLIADEKFDMSTVSAVCVQLAIVALEIATAQLLKTWGIVPELVTGHSLGEYSALCVAGVLSVSDTLFLVGQRAQLMENRLTVGAYSMLAISKDFQDVHQLLASESGTAWRDTDIACINAPQVTVVSGPVEEIGSLKTKLEEDGSRATLLTVPYGFHSRHIEPVLVDLGIIASGIIFSAPTIPIASTLLGEIVPIGKNGVFSPSYLTRQARERVNFVGAMEACKIAGFAKPQTNWVGIGPEPVCIGLVRRTLEIPTTRLLATMKSKEDNWITISSTLATLYKYGASINWPQYYKEFKSSLRLVALPTYAFDVKDFWTPYVEHNVPTAAVSAMSDKALQKILNTQGVPSFSTTSLQWVESEILDGQNISVSFASYTSDPSLCKAIQGHVVNGITVCSLSIFCDMAKSAAQYAYQKIKGAKTIPMMSVLHVDMTHALVVPELDPELIVKTIVSYSSNGNKAVVKFQSTKSGISTDHGSCEVVFEESSAWFSQLSQILFLTNARMQSLKDMSTTGKAHRLLKPVIYKLFSNLVTYSKDYQGMEEVLVDAECHDAIATIKLPNTTGSGFFLYNPFWIDAAIHLAGFLLNGGLRYEENIVCLSTGFESWRVLKELQSDKTYTTYVNMQEAETPNTLTSSAYVYDSDQKLVQVTTGIKFMKLKKLILNSVLGGGAPSSVGVKKAIVNSSSPVTSPKILKASDSSIITIEAQLSDESSEKGSPSDGTLTQDSSVSEGGGENLLDAFLAIVASESGYNVEDMEQDIAFADMGMDSLMGITIIATVLRDTGVELPATFLLDNPTVGDAKIALLGDDQPELTFEPVTEVEKAQENDSVQAAPVSQDLTSEHVPKSETHRPIPRLLSTTTDVVPNPTGVSRQSKAVLLQGSSSSTGSKLFLLPDGSGSPSPYIQLPTIGIDVNVYGLESPFLKVPMEYVCDLETICSSFVEAIKVVQPAGSYILAGYSLGAIYAYEVAQQLLKNNEQVDSLTLIDMAAPKMTVSGFPSQEQLKDAGIIPSTSRQTEVQKEHVVRTIQAMTNYHLSPCPLSQRPKKTVLISSNAGLATGKQSELAKWAQGRDSASRGWEEMVGPVEKHAIEAKHFSLLRLPAVSFICLVLYII